MKNVTAHKGEKFTLSLKVVFKGLGERGISIVDRDAFYLDIYDKFPFPIHYPIYIQVPLEQM